MILPFAWVNESNRVLKRFTARAFVRYPYRPGRSVRQRTLSRLFFGAVRFRPRWQTRARRVLELSVRSQERRHGPRDRPLWSQLREEPLPRRDLLTQRWGIRFPGLLCNRHSVPHSRDKDRGDIVVRGNCLSSTPMHSLNG